MQVLVEKVREDIRQKYNAKEVFNLIEEFLVKQSRLSSTKALVFEQQISDRTAKLSQEDAKLGTLATNLYKLKNQYLLLYKVMETKFVHLVRAMVDALNKEDFLLLALCSRSLVEHAAFISYLVRQARVEEVEALFDLYGKSLYSTRFFGQEGLVDTLNLLSMVDESLSIDSEETKECYSCLCDFVHPAFSSNVMIFDEKPGEGTMGPSPEQKKAAVEKVLQAVGTAMRFLDYEADSFASVGITIEDYIQKTVRPGTTPESLVDMRPAPAKPRVERPRQAEEQASLRHGPFGGATFFNRNGKTWLRY